MKDAKNRNEYFRNYMRLRRQRLISQGVIKRKQKEHVYRTDEEIESIAKRFTTLKEFRESETNVYTAALKRGLIEKFSWLKRCFAWTKDLCEIESRKYAGMGRTAFQKGCMSAYQASRKNGWIDSFVWLGVKQNPHTDNIYCVYKYAFNDRHAIYIGLTMNRSQRDNAHRTAPHGKKSAVLRFAEANNCSIPKMEVLQDNLSCIDAQQCEHDAVEFFRSEGWKILNVKKTGVGVGSIGLSAKKWTKNKVFELAISCSSPKQFERTNRSAYEVALKNKWIGDMTWLKRRVQCNG